MTYKEFEHALNEFLEKLQKSGEVQIEKKMYSEEVIVFRNKTNNMYWATYTESLYDEYLKYDSLEKIFQYLTDAVKHYLFGSD